MFENQKRLTHTSNTNTQSLQKQGNAHQWNQVKPRDGSTSNSLQQTNDSHQQLWADTDLEGRCQN